MALAALARLGFTWMAMTAAIVQPLCYQKNKLLFLLHPMFGTCYHKCTLTTSTEAMIEEVEEEEEADEYGNGNNTYAGIDMCGDVRRLCERGRLKEAIRILHIMDRRAIRPGSATYASLLQQCTEKKALTEGQLVHSHMIDMGFHSNILLGNKLVVMYAKCGSLADARRELEEMPEPNVVSWTAVIAAHARHGLNEEALSLFCQMQRTGIQPNHYTFASVLPACANLADVERGKKLHEDIISGGFESNVFVGNALVDMYAKCGRIADARQLFDKMPERDVVSWNAMIAGYAESGCVGEALKLFEKMPERDLISWNAMITAYAQNGDADLAGNFFQKMPERGMVSWNAMISGYVQNGHVTEALKMFQKIPEPNVVSWNAMITGYAQIGHVDEALALFQKMPRLNSVSWNSMIAGFTQNGHFNEALKLFGQMSLVGVRPNTITFVNVLPACANLAVPERGKEIHRDIIKNGFQSDIFVGNTLLDMYAKCGLLHDAHNVFGKMLERTVVSWTAMIVGYAMHGYGKEALQVFEQMQLSGMRPNHVTFIGVLSACCHTGLVDDGWQYFERMRGEYHITPTVEHYCCMVDLLGRAGRLYEAHDFINKMPIKPNAFVWGSLLGACRIHANIELGCHVAEKLFQLEPTNASFYVLLSNIYAAAGKWDDVEKVRKMMKDRKIKKIPGCSWVEVNNKVYSFVTNDRSHPQTDEIYAMLERLSGHMKEVGYVPDKNLVLHDVEDEQKEHVLCYHSEKLAIAFGLIHASPGAPIRIVKNLRVCGDCHSAAKFISRIAAQEIVLRDANRFHHIKDGQCSCGDYW